MRQLSVILFLVASLSFAQEPKIVELYKTQYPNSNTVRLNQKTTVTISIKEENLAIKQEFFKEDLYLDESANHNSKKALHFSSFFELEKVEASSFTFIDGKYKEFEVTEFKEKDELDQSFYDDTKSLNFILPNLKKGSKSVVKYSENVKNPRFLSPVYFGDFSPIINNSFTIIADKNVNLSFKTFNADSLDIHFNKKEKKHTTIYTWKLNNTNKYKYESNAPTYKKILPHIIPIITSYKSGNKNINLANEVGDLYNWYFSLVKDINKGTVDDTLVVLVNNLTTGKTSDLEKVKAIYYWTQKNIKYIAFEYALGGFVPRQANEVFLKKYGDCKDNSSILYKMLDIAGLEGNLTWIGTRSIPYTYEEVPTPIVDNHMILSYTANNTTYFLDATGRYIPLELPTSFIQGKEALIANGEGQFTIKKVPVVPAHKNAIVDNTTISLSNGHVSGTSSTKISGYHKVNYFNDLETETTNDKIKAFYNLRLRKGNNKFLVQTLKETNKFDYEKDFTVDYRFDIEDYAKQIGNEIYLNLNLNKDLLFYKTEEDRTHDLEYSYKTYFEYNTTCIIPQGYTIDYLPKNLTLSNDLMETTLSYSKKDNKIIYKHTATLNFINLNTQQQKEVNTIIKQIEKAYKEVVVFKKL